jgi:putative CocE/NonD family hydrolase
MIDMGELEADWFDWTLKGGAKPRLLQKRVAYYVTGADVWKYADSLSELGRHPTKYYLSSPGRGAETAAHAGLLATAQPSATPADQWTYDPLDTRPGERPVDKELDFSPEADGAGLVYQTAPFDRVTEISGFPKLTLWLKLDVPDTDIWVTLYEVTAAGKALNLDDVPLRLRYRESRVQPTLITPGQATKVEFDRFRFMSRAVARGSRIRLVIQSPNSIRVQKNYNSGGDVALETAKDAKTAHIQLLHEGNTWSVLELPVAK